MGKLHGSAGASPALLREFNGAPAAIARDRTLVEAVGIEDLTVLMTSPHCRDASFPSTLCDCAVGCSLLWFSRIVVAKRGVGFRNVL